MQKTQRQQLFRIYLETILSEGGEGNFLIFTEPKSEKFVQLIGSPISSRLILDIPKAELSSSEARRLMNQLGGIGLEDFEEYEYSYQAEVDIGGAIDSIEIIFLDVFNLPYSYSINCKLNLEK